jgi:phosphoribosylformylglycinamidine cyclo-ligase
LQETGNISEAEMFRTFNMGIGMAMVAPAAAADEILKAVKEKNTQASIIGQIEKQEEQEPEVVIS